MIAADSSSLDLKSLFETSRLFNSTYDLSFISQHILRTLMGKLLVSRCSLHLTSLTDSTIIQTIAAKGSFRPALPEVLTEAELESIAASHHMTRHELISNGNRIGFLLLGKSLANRPFSEQEVFFIDSILQFSSGALENSMRFQEIKAAKSVLARKVQELKTLYELSKEINGILEPRSVFSLFSLTVLGQGLFNGVTIFHQSEEGEYLYVYHKGAGSQTKNLVWNRDFHQDLFLLPVNDPDYPLFYQKPSGDLLIIPLSQSKKGMIVLKQSPAIQTLNTAELDFYHSLSHLLELTCSNIANFNEALQKQQMENELAIARDIQNALLPSVFNGYEPLDIYGINVPSKQVGGDYFDVFRLDQNRILVAIADVTGKGTPASLLMANLQSMIKILVQFPLSLSEMTSKINDIIFQNTAADKFITFFWGIIDTSTQKMTYVNAGHNPPYHEKNGEITELGIGGLILGIMTSFIPYEMGEIDFRPGERLFIFTDGVTEAMNLAGEEFEEEKLIGLIKTWGSESSKEFAQRVQTEVLNHAGSAPQSDDITIIAVKWPTISVF